MRWWRLSNRIRLCTLYGLQRQKSYLKQHPEVIQSFTNAIQKGLDYVNSHSSEEIAKVISPHFKETPVDKLALIVDRYKSQDTWKEDTVFEENSFTLLKRILEEAGELKAEVPYNELVTMDFSKKQQKILNNTLDKYSLFIYNSPNYHCITLLYKVLASSLC